MKLKYILSTVAILIAIQNSGAQNSLSGIITDKGNKEPMADIAVYIPDLHAATTTDSLGYYKFNKVPAASYQIQINALGYKTYTGLVHIKGATKQNFELDQSNTELAEVVVTGSSKSTEVRKSPLPITLMNKEELTTNLSTNIIDAIAKIPGVSAVTTGPNVSKPFIRGLGFNRILTLYDGVRQEGQQWGDEHGIEMDEYGIDRIEIIKGPASLMYGSDALAGVVNLIPNKPANDNKIEGSATTEYQSNNGMFGGSLYLTGNKNGLEWGARASKRMAKDYQNAIDGRVYNTAFNETAANAFVGLHRNWGFSHLSLSLYDNLQEIPDGGRDSLSRRFTKQITEADDSRPEVSDEELNSYKMSVIHQHVQHYMAFLKNSIFFGDSKLDVNFGFQRSVRQEFSHPEVPYQNVPGLDLQLNTLNYDTKYFLPEFNKWAFAVGVNGMYQHNNVTEGTEFVIPSYNQFDIGGFVTVKKDFGSFNLSGGLRYDVRTFNNKELYIKPNATSGFDEAVGSDVAGAEQAFSAYSTVFQGLTGSFGMSYALSNQLSFKFNLSRGYRAPNISEISANGVHPGTGLFQIGNDAFKPEFSNQADIGANFSSKSVKAGVSLFVNQIQNYIFNQKLASQNGGDSISLKGGQPYPTYKYQQGKVFLYGMEANVDFHIVKNLHFENSISLIYGNNNSFTGAEKTDETKYVPLMPPFRYISELRYQFAEKKGLFASPFIKLQMQYTATQNRVFSYDNTETPTAGYTLFNLGAGTGFKNKQGKTILNMYVFANNLFNVSYQDHLSRLKYFEEYTASPNGHLGIYNMGRNISVKLIKNF